MNELRIAVRQYAFLASCIAALVVAVGASQSPNTQPEMVVVMVPGCPVPVLMTEDQAALFWWRPFITTQQAVTGSDG